MPCPSMRDPKPGCSTVVKGFICLHAIFFWHSTITPPCCRVCFLFFVGLETEVAFLSRTPHGILFVIANNNNNDNNNTTPFLYTVYEYLVRYFWQYRDQPISASVRLLDSFILQRSHPRPTRTLFAGLFPSFSTFRHPRAASCSLVLSLLLDRPKGGLLTLRCHHRRRTPRRRSRRRSRRHSRHHQLLVRAPTCLRRAPAAETRGQDALPRWYLLIWVLGPW